MEITEIRIKLMDNPSERLQAFCSVTLDGCFVIRDLKIIQGARGSFVAMPSRKLMDRCPRCTCKNHLRAKYCNECGVQLHEERAIKSDDGRAKLYADIAHPINSECRERIQQEIVVAYALELERSKLPGYICTYDDFGEENYAAVAEDYNEHETLSIKPVFAHANGRHVANGLQGTNGLQGEVETSAATATMATPPKPKLTYVNRVAKLEEEGFGAGLM